jgi:hypothetical protein
VTSACLPWLARDTSALKGTGAAREVAAVSCQSCIASKSTHAYKPAQKVHVLLTHRVSTPSPPGTPIQTCCAADTSRQHKTGSWYSIRTHPAAHTVPTVLMRNRCSLETQHTAQSQSSHATQKAPAQPDLMLPQLQHTIRCYCARPSSATSMQCQKQSRNTGLLHNMHLICC